MRGIGVLALVVTGSIPIFAAARSIGGRGGPDPEKVRALEGRAVGPVNTWVTLYSENLEPIVGGRVHFRSPSNSLVHVTGEAGNTPPIALLPGASFDLAFKSIAQPEGRALGQLVRGWQVPQPPTTYPSDTYVYCESIFSQPFLRPVVLSSAGHLTSLRQDSLWSFQPNPASPSEFSMSVSVGSLSTGESLRRFLDYSSVTPLESDYRYALGIQTEEVEDFGEDGGIFDLYCADLGFQSEPAVDGYFLAASDSELGASTLTTARFWNDGHLRILVSGTLGKGITLLALRPDEGPPSHALQEFVVHNPVFPPRSQALQSQAASVCTPDPPSCENRPCDPPVPPRRVDGEGHCDLQPTENEGLTEGCSLRVGDIHCGSSGTVRIGGKTSWGVSVSVQFKLRGVRVAPGGHYDDDSEEYQDVPLGPGLGCGQCVQMFKLRCVVRQYWIVESPVYAGRSLGGGLAFLYCQDLDDQSACVLSYQVPVYCDIRCN